MSRFSNDSTRASHPGRVTLSLERLHEIEPLLSSSTATFQCGPLCPVEHPAAEMRERFTEYLARGDSRAAVVVSIEPFLVAAYTEDLDACVLLRFPSAIAREKGMTVGTRLLGVNTFANVATKTGERLYAGDIVPGPERSGWSNFTR